MSAEMGNIDISVEIEADDLNVETLRRLVAGVLDIYGASQASVGIAIVDDEAISQVHRDFLDDEKTTDVISFDLSDQGEGNERVFDLIVNAEMAARQAANRPHNREAELALYITHGLLHNLGFDDLDPASAEKMHEAEDEILQNAGFGVVYASGER